MHLKGPFLPDLTLQNYVGSVSLNNNECIYFINEYKYFCHKIKCNIFFNLLKGIYPAIVHPKMKMLSSFTHPQVVPNLYVFFFC